MDNIKIIYGENTFMVEKTVKSIKKQFGDIVLGINFVVIQSENINNIISEIETPAFGYEKKLIIVNKCGLLQKELKTKKTNNNIIANELANYIENNLNVFENVILVIVEETVDKANVLFKCVQSKGIVNEYKELTSFELENQLVSLCGAYKVYLSKDMAKYIVELCGTSLQELINECRKLIEYVGENGIIDKKAIDLLAVPKIEAVIFELSDKLANKNIIEALKVLEKLKYNKEPSQKILITLYNHFKKIYITKIAIKEKCSIEDVLHLKSSQMFLVMKYKKQANAFSEQELRAILDDLINLDYDSKSGLIDIDIGIETFLCKW